MANLPTGTVTLLFTDIESSTHLLHQLKDRYPDVLAEHRRLLRGVFATHRGVEVDTQGDAFFVAFADARDAVAAARDAQLALAGSPARVRMGIHTGAPAATDEGYVGIDVHRASRICAAGHGGQVLLSYSTQSLIRSDIELRDLGEHRLKDLQEPEWLFQLLIPDQRQQFPPLRSLSNTNLPAETSSLVGRQRELSELSALLAREDVRLVTLTGPGGTGKTRLALRVAAQLVEDFKNGVFLVALAPLSDPDLVLETIAQTLGVKERAGEALADRVRRHLEGKTVLLILDNFEHLLPAVREVGRLLRSATQLKVLATSRERLRILGEHEYVVPPLTEDDGAVLFAERARAVESTFRLEPERELVMRICRRLDVLPLAIELAAARVKALSLNELLLRLERRLPVLVSGPRDLPERQQTLRATIAWSYELLDQQEQLALARLAVFAGGCTLDGARAVATADDDTIASLVDKSLLRRAGDRYSMLETIREFALERLDDSADRDEIERRHAEHIASLVVPLGREARRSAAVALRRLDIEHDNARAAFDWALTHGRLDLCEQVVEGLCFYWLVRGHIREGYQRAKAAFDRSPSPSAFFALLTGELARYAGDFGAGVELKQRAAAAYEADADRPGLAMALADLAETLVEAGELNRAEAAANQALSVRREIGGPWGIAHANSALVRVELGRGNYTRAAALSEHSIPVYRDAKSWADLAWECVLAATAYRRAGDLRLARQRLREGFHVGGEFASGLALIPGLEQAAALAAADGQDDVALRLYGAARALRDSAGYTFAVDDTAIVVSGSRLERARRDALLAEGAGWELEEAARRALEALEIPGSNEASLAAASTEAQPS